MEKLRTLKDDPRRTTRAGVFRRLDVGKGKHPAWARGDCQVRALSVATGRHYEAAWNLLYQLQGKHRTPGFALHRYLDHDPEPIGVIRRLSFPAKRGRRRLTVEDFCGQHPRGNFILHVQAGGKSHMVAVEDGLFYDSWDCSRKCVYVAWEVREVAREDRP